MSKPRKTAIGTGASQGIGAGIVKEFVQRGFNVVANSRKVTQSTEVTASNHVALVHGRIGAELDVEAGRKAARIAKLNVLAVARQHVGSLDRVRRIVRLGVSMSTSGDIRDQPKVADATSELLQDVFGKYRAPCRLVYGVASLPLGTPVDLEIIFEVE